MWLSVGGSGCDYFNSGDVIDIGESFWWKFYILSLFSFSNFYLLFSVSSQSSLFGFSIKMMLPVVASLVAHLLHWPHQLASTVGLDV